MAKQEGILPIKGTIDNITFYKSKDGFLVRKKGGLTGERIATDPAFQRTRENNAEFGRAGAASRLFPNAFRAVIALAADSRMVSRLSTLFIKVVKSDTGSIRGERNVSSGDMVPLKGFEFNQTGKFNTTFYAPFVPTVDRVSGGLSVAIAPFVPQNMIAAPGGTTHFKLVVSGASVNFETEAYVADYTENAILPMDNTLTAPITLAVQVDPASMNPLFLLLGIQFFQEINGEKYQLKNGSYNALQVVAAEQV